MLPWLAAAIVAYLLCAVVAMTHWRVRWATPTLDGDDVFGMVIVAVGWPVYTVISVAIGLHTQLFEALTRRQSAKRLAKATVVQ